MTTPSKGVKEQDGTSMLRCAILAYQEAEVIAGGNKTSAVLMRSQMFLKIHWKNIQKLATMARP